MQLAYQAPLIRIVASNANITGDWFRVPIGSSIRLIQSIAAIVGAPAGTVTVDYMTTDGNFVVAITLAAIGPGSLTAAATLASEFIRIRLVQAGGANTLTMVDDVIVSPPDSLSA